MHLGQGYASLLTCVLDKDNTDIGDEQMISFELNQSYVPLLSVTVLVFRFDKVTMTDNLGHGEYGDRCDHG